MNIEKGWMEMTNAGRGTELQVVLTNNKKMEEQIMNEQYYIVRGDRSGVFFGRIKSRTGQEVEMEHARCIWYWDGAATLLQMATEGVSNPDKCKFTVYVDAITIVDAIETIPCTDAAVRSIMGVPEWRR